MSSYIYFYLCIFFRVDFKNIIKYTAMTSIVNIFMEAIFSRSDTRPTQVTWPNLIDLIGWGQQISSTSW